MIRMTGGTSSVATMIAKTAFLPRKFIRASGYAASDETTEAGFQIHQSLVAVVTTITAWSSAAIMLFANHRSTGVLDELKISA